MAELIVRIKEDMKVAMKARDKPTVGAIRLILAAFKQIEVDERITLDSSRQTTVLDKMLKQRRDSIQQFQAADRHDLIAIEQTEIAVIQRYLPKPFNDGEISTLIAKAIADSAATSAKDMGKVMGILKPQMLGRADMAVVSGLVKSQLAAI